MSKNQSPLSPSERFAILMRDGFACLYCGARSPEARLHVDHIRPRSDGGGNEPDNLATSCDRCNLGKSVTSIPVFWRQQRGYATGAFLCERTIEKFRDAVTPALLYHLIQYAHELRPENARWAVEHADDAWDVLANVKQSLAMDGLNDEDGE